MIDLAKIQYRVVVMDESKNQYNIKEYIENLGWEENDGELSVRTSFVAKNDKTSKGYLSKIIKPGCLVGVFATDGASQDEEVARGYVETWNPVEKSGGHTLKCTCYDELYKLQKSQDNRYFPSGTGTKSAIEGIFDDWEIPQGSYQALVYGGRQYSLHIGQQIQTDYRDQLPDSDSRQIRREVGDMVIVGYYAHGNKHYVAFKDEADTKGRFMITDGFHDRPVTERNQGKYEGYVKIDKAECNIKKIIGRIRGTRPWHPLLRLLQKEAG